ncbi:MAG: hypothetical protein OXG68_05990 [Chloroflexi bacterium]|nr:hypothetical protein [Chloroflexota bacterium]
MFKRCLNLWLAASLLLMVCAGISAQSDYQGIDYCAIMTAPDCAIKNSNSAVMDEVYAFALSLSMRMDIEAADPAESASVTMEGGGRVALDPALIEASTALETATGMDSATIVALANELIGGLAGEMSLILTTTSADESMELPLDLLMKDGVVAVNMAAFGEESDESMAGWLGIELADIVESAGLKDSEAAGETHDLDYEAVTRAMTIVRLSDSELNGQPVAVFQTDLDFGALMESIGMAELTEAMSADAAAMDFVGDASLQVVEYISLADFTTQRLEVAISTMDEAAAEFALAMTMRLDLSDFNNAVDVALPEDVFVIPLAMMQQMNQ